MTTGQQIREMSDKAFARHTITQRLNDGMFRSWRCMTQGSWAYGFDITTIPGSLILTGDLGTLVVSREVDMIPWCRGSVDSTSYFAEKVASEIATKEFNRDKLRAWIDERLNDDELKLKDRTTLEDIRDWQLDDNGEDWFYRELEDVWAGEDPPNWRDWKPQFLWQRDAVRWFVNNLDKAAT